MNKKSILIITFSSLLLFIISCSSTQNKLNGTWIPVKQEMGDMQIPDSGFAKQKLVISDSNYTVTAESVDKGVMRCKDDKMDIYGKDGVNAGKHFTAVYKLEKDQLWICYNLKGDSYPSGFDTKGQDMWFISVFKKQ